MAVVEVKVPVFSESITEGTLLGWKKKVGERIERGDPLIDIETDKVVLEVTALEGGVLTEVKKGEGDIVTAQEVIGAIDTSAAAAPVAVAAAQAVNATATVGKSATAVATPEAVGPAARKAAAENGVNLADVAGTGKDGRATKADVLAHKPTPVVANLPSGPRIEQRVPMTRIRARIAERLKQAQNTAAILTTYNEVNMQPVMDLRKKYQDEFVKKHGIKLGFMSFFVKAATEALKQFPVVNASVDGNDVIYHGFFDIGIAVASERGLVVPILRNTDGMTLAGIEGAIGAYATKAKDGKLTLDDMSGGTFSITNGGTFGSMMSTPILNPPQSAILGMHNIVERAVVENGQIVARPMMYLALSYDHRIIDGREAVLFLVAIKKMLEDPARLLLDL
ncbi:MAG: dihydrolipoamide succinyltransferase [Cyanobacteria bacterium RYN_339]|nr:dihydrolipoamide succinyltransferase [Cyanobacteria bacterium RYN_339]